MIPGATSILARVLAIPEEDDVLAVRSIVRHVPADGQREVLEALGLVDVETPTWRRTR